MVVCQWRVRVSVPCRWVRADEVVWCGAGGGVGELVEQGHGSDGPAERVSDVVLLIGEERELGVGQREAGFVVEFLFDGE